MQKTAREKLKLSAAWSQLMLMVSLFLSHRHTIQYQTRRRIWNHSKPPLSVNNHNLTFTSRLLSCGANKFTPQLCILSLCEMDTLKIDSLGILLVKMDAGLLYLNMSSVYAQTFWLSQQIIFIPFSVSWSKFEYKVTQTLQRFVVSKIE